jgi:hypothetical protein
VVDTRDLFRLVFLLEECATGGANAFEAGKVVEGGGRPVLANRL